MWVFIFSIFKRAAKQSPSSPLFPLPIKIVTNLALLLTKKFLAAEDALSIKRKEVSFVLVSLSSINLDFFDPNKSNEILEVSKSYGDILIVGVNSDDSIKKLKGPTRPKISQKDRLRILSSIKYVDYVLLFEEETPLKLIEKIKPNFLVKGGDYSLEDIVGAEFVENNGGQVEIVKLLEGHSSSSLIDKFEN